MVKHCSYGTCNSDTRNPGELDGAIFIPFIKPKSDLERCRRWIKSCNRPYDQLNEMKITKHVYICSKHFYNGKGPSDDYPDPCDAVTGEFKKARKLPKRYDVNQSNIEMDGEKVEHREPLFEDIPTGISTQTEETLFSSMDLLAYAARIKELEDEVKELKEESLRTAQTQTKPPLISRSSQTDPEEPAPKPLNVDLANSSKIKGLFKYYTGLTYARFLVLLAFLFPKSDENPVCYDKKRNDISKMPYREQVFLVLCRLRNGFHIKDVAFRFSLKPQSVSTLFKGLIKYMYFQLGSLSFWPSRNVIIENMPFRYKEQFPTCIAILDCTEIKMERPSSVKCQSQCYSDYKSSTTLKSLIVCDPRGSIMFVSDLFSGSISDNQICKQCGFYDYIQNLKDKEFLQDGDSFMADKGFRIEKELSELGFSLNVPPFATSGSAFSASDIALTRKIAAHRIHVERAINKIKCFKLVSRRVPISLLHSINDVWFVAALLTNFQNTLVKKGTNSTSTVP